MQAAWLPKILKLAAVVGAIGIAWWVGHYQAWHASLRGKFSDGALLVAMVTHYLSKLRGRSCLDPELEQSIVTQIQGHLARLGVVNELSDRSLLWTLRYPRAWLEITRMPKATRPLQEFYERARRAGVDLSDIEPRLPGAAM